MTRIEFIDLIFEFFKVKDDIEALKRIYDTALTLDKKINWQALYMNVLQTAESRYLPPPKWFIEKTKNFIVYENTSLDGYLVRVYFKSGRKTDFTVCNCDYSLEKVVNTYKGRDDVLRAYLYEPNVTFIGDQIYPKNAKGKLIYSI